MPLFVEGGPDPRDGLAVPQDGSMGPGLVQQSPNLRVPLGRPEADPFAKPSSAEYLPAAFRQASPVGAFIDTIMNSSIDVRPDPTHNPLDTIKGTKWESRPDLFVGSPNEIQTRSIMARADRADADRKTLEASGTAGTVAAFGMGLIDPLLALPAGGIIRNAKGGINWLMSTASVAALGGVQGAGDELFFRAADPTRTNADSAFSIASATVLSGLLGGGAMAVLSRGESRSLTRAMDQDRNAISRTAGLPEGPVTPHLEGIPAERQDLQLGQRVEGGGAAGHILGVDGEMAVIRTAEGGPEGVRVPLADVRAAGGLADAETTARMMDEHAATVEAPRGSGLGIPASAGAAASDGTLTLKSFLTDKIPVVGDAFASLNSRFSPTMRVFSSEIQSAKRAAADLVETALAFKENALGQTTTSMGGGAISRLVETQKNRLFMQATTDLRDLFAEYRYGDAAKKNAIAQSTIEDLRGLQGDMLGFKQFKEEVSAALRNNDVHENPQVQEAAQRIRKNVLEPIEKLAVEAGLLSAERAAPKGDKSFLSRVWNKEAVAAKFNDFVKKTADWYEGEQTVARQAQERISGLDEERRAAERQLRKIEGRLETQQQRAEQIGAQLKERVVELNAADKRVDTLADRAGILREGISELEEFVSSMRQELRDPDMLGRVADLDEELKALRKEERDSRMTKADLEKRDAQEVQGTLIGPMRAAAELFIGKRNMKRFLKSEAKVDPATEFLRDLKRVGVYDPGGDVAAVLNGNHPEIVRESRASRSLTQEEGKKAGLSIDEWGQRLAEAYGQGRDVPRLTEKEVIDGIADAAAGRTPSWMREHEARLRQDADASKTAVSHHLDYLQDMWDHLGLDKPTSIKDMARMLNDEKAVTLEDLEREAARQREVGADIPPSVRLEDAETQRAQIKAARSEVQRLIDTAIQNRRSRERALSKADAVGREADVAVTRSEGRFSLLSDRLDRNAVMQDLLEAARKTAEDASTGARKKIEDELRAWKGNSSADAMAALKARDKAEAARGEGKSARLTGADGPVDRAVKRILNSDRDLSRQELESRARETANRILGSVDGRLSYDAPMGGPRQGPPADKEALRGSLKERDFAIPTHLVSDFVENDVEHTVKVFLRTMLPDIMIHQRFGDVEMTDVFRKINEEFDAKKAGAGANEKALTKLENERQRIISDVAAMRDRVRGVYGWSPDASTRNAARIAMAAKWYNTITDLGSVVLNSAPDMAGAVFRHGFENVFKDAWRPFFQGMAGMSDLAAKQRREANAMGIALEAHLNLRSHALNDVMEGYRPGSRFERGMQWAADKSQLVNGQAYYTDMVKTLASSTVSNEILRLAERIENGTAAAKDIEKLASANVDASMARRIWKEFSNGGGETINGTHVTNTADWKDEAVRSAFESAVARDVDIAVITPGAEKPLFMSRPIGSLLGQFKAFTAASHERLLLAQLQQADARTVQGLFATVALGMLSYRLYTLVANQKASDRPQDWIKEGISRSGVMGWFDEANNMTANMTSGSVDMYRAIGADKPLSRFQQRSPMAALLGPTYSKVEGMRSALGAAWRGDWSASDTDRVRRLMPLQNHALLRVPLTMMSEGVNEAFGIPARKEVQAAPR